MNITCQVCSKAMATVHLTDLMGGEKQERHLCSECAEDEGVIMKPKAQLNEMLQKFVMHKSMAQEMADLTCTYCGLSFVEFRRQGLLGCPHDYDAFKKALEPLIERSHEDNVQHVGKIPVRAGEHVRARQTAARLKRELEQALQEEAYEKAARLRDEIENLDPS